MDIVKPLKNIIATDSNTLEKLIDQSNKLLALTAVLQKNLASDIGQHCRVAGYSKGVLTLAVGNASWATQIRYNSPEIIEQLSKTPEFKKIKTIKCFVQAQPVESPKAQKQRSQLDLAAAKKLYQYAAKIPGKKPKKQGSTSV